MKLTSAGLVAVMVACLVGGALTACRVPSLSDAEATVDRSVDRAMNRVDQSTLYAQARVDASVVHAKTSMDDSLAQAEERLGRSLEKAQATALATVAEVRAQYDEALVGTSEEVSKLREEVKKDLDDLEQQIEERIDQLKTASLEVIAAGDKAAEERIDQVFEEMRTFVKEVIAELRNLILPVMDLAASLNTSVQGGNEAIEKITQQIIALIEQVQGVFKEVKDILHQVQGEKSDGTPGGNTEGLLGLIFGTIGTVAAGYFGWKRSADKKADGDRWKPEELRELVKTSTEDYIKMGVFDDEMLGLLARKGFVQVNAVQGRIPLAENGTCVEPPCDDPA